MIPSMPYAPREYWGRLHQRGDLSAVGQSALPAAMNAWLYRILAGHVEAFLRRHRLLDLPPQAAFDVGSGTGYWVAFWHRLGVPRVDGCDLVPAAVDRLQELAHQQGWPDRFVVADIGEPGSLPSERYPMVSCCNVLLHLTDDDAFRRGLEAVAGLVAEGGHLLLVEPLLLHPEYAPPFDPARHSRARTREAYLAPLEAAGLVLVDLRAATVLANNPIEAGSPAAFRRYRAWWGFVSRRAKAGDGAARWLGPLLWLLDGIAIRTGAAPSSKLVLLRRPVGRQS
jgi:SAM-dependent methyltransferase